MFNLSPLFILRESHTQGIVDLLEATTLGTNGAKYKHLDTAERIKEADAPLFLSMERNDKVLGNITFCQRGRNWYIRYFAFQSFLQGSDSKSKHPKGNSTLKHELGKFFDEALNLSDSVDSMYAYIDPKNDRSKWMSENFGFHKMGELATQSFSRIYPKKSARLSKIDDWNEIASIVRAFYGNNHYYFETHCSKPPFYVLKNEINEIVALARTVTVHWEIVRMPGKMGGLLTKMIPYIPFLRKLIQPKNHTFLVPEIVWTKNNDAKLLIELFEGILADQGLNLILWWTDTRNPLYKNVQSNVKWGLLHKLIGVAPVDVVQLRSKSYNHRSKEPIFVTAYDMV